MITWLQEASNKADAAKRHVKELNFGQVADDLRGIDELHHQLMHWVNVFYNREHDDSDGY